MRLMHLADLHLGKTLHALSMIESGDQPHWIGQILELIARERPDAVVIAGDVYDRSVPARDAIPLLSRLLTGISDLGIPVFAVAGNHDGAERLEFASELLSRQNVYIAGSVRREMMHVTIDPDDGFGPVTFWLMPYLFPAAVRQALELPEDEITSYTEAAQRLLGEQRIDLTQRNVLVAHQTVLYQGVEPEHERSETMVGGVGGIDAGVFEGFDYVALGHIHASRKAAGERIRYAGSPLCYHFSEAGQRKGPLLVTLEGKESVPRAEIRELIPLHRVRETMRGTLREIREAEERSTAADEYVRVELTDDWVEPDTYEQLDALFRSHGCYLLELVRDPERRRSAAEVGDAGSAPEELSPEEHFREFYRRQTGKADPTDPEMDLIRFTLDQIGRAGEESAEQLAEELAKYALLKAQRPGTEVNEE